MEPATRQKAGRLGIAFAPGGVNSPAGRLSARLMTVCGTWRVERLSQVAAKAGIAPRASMIANFIGEMVIRQRQGGQVPESIGPARFALRDGWCGLCPRSAYSA